jgi:hypothetical protein
MLLYLCVKASSGLFNKVHANARLATYEEIEKFEKKDVYKISQEGRTVLFKPTKPLPNRSQVTVTVGPNVCPITVTVFSYYI